MKQIFVILSILFPFIQAAVPLLPRAIGDACSAPLGSGTCQNTADCKGLTTPGYCLSDPDNVECCTNIDCKTPSGDGLCRNTGQGCSGGKFVSGYCPGDSSIECCVLDATDPTSTKAAPKPSPTLDICETPQPNSCAFYPDCLEAHEQCGPTGYPLGYGLYYCEKFTGAAPQMSSKGQEWVTNTMLCLQNKLVPYGTGREHLSCDDLKSFAFGTHPACYVGSGVCSLPPGDWAVIVKTVSLKELFNSIDALKATLKTASGCAAFYFWLIGKKIIGIIKDAENLWDKITDFL